MGSWWGYGAEQWYLGRQVEREAGKWVRQEYVFCRSVNGIDVRYITEDTEINGILLLVDHEYKRSHWLLGKTWYFPSDCYLDVGRTTSCPHQMIAATKLLHHSGEVLFPSMSEVVYREGLVQGACWKMKVKELFLMEAPNVQGVPKSFPCDQRWLNSQAWVWIRVSILLAIQRRKILTASIFLADLFLSTHSRRRPPFQAPPDRQHPPQHPHLLIPFSSLCSCQM